MIKIIDNNTKLVKDIKLGQLFRYGGRLYIRSKITILMKPACHMHIFAFDIIDSTLAYFGTTDKAEEVNGELTIV
jgi:hypothetical protein